MGVGCLAVTEDVLDQIGGHHILCFLLLLGYVDFTSATIISSCLWIRFFIT